MPALGHALSLCGQRLVCHDDALWFATERRRSATKRTKRIVKCEESERWAKLLSCPCQRGAITWTHVVPLVYSMKAARSRSKGSEDTLGMFSLSCEDVKVSSIIITFLILRRGSGGRASRVSRECMEGDECQSDTFCGDCE